MRVLESSNAGAQRTPVRAKHGRRWRVDVLFLAALFVLLSLAGPATAGENLRFPPTVRTIDGENLDVLALAARSTLVVVTLKAHGCPICTQQLVRINGRREELQDCGIDFLVLAPGPADELRKIRDKTGFDHPFVADTDLKIAESLELKLSEDEITPAILMLERDLTVGWMQVGRAGNFYGDGALVRQVACWKKISI